MLLKKIFIVSTILLMLVVVFFGIYIVAFKDNQVITKDEQNNIADIADIASEKITNITSDPIKAATIGPDTNTIRYYDAVDGRAWTMTLRGTNKEVLVSETEGVPQSVKWSPNGGEMAILTFQNKIIVNNISTGEKYNLREGMDNIEWTDIPGKILYKYFNKDTKERSLNIANADGNNWKKLADIPFRYASFSQIPTSIMVAFWPTADLNTPTQLLTVSSINRNNTPKEITSGLKGADFLFSPNGEKILVSSVSDDGKKNILGVMDSNGKNYTDLLVATIIKKAVWSKDSKTVYYAQPTDIPEDAKWPNDYIDGKFNTKDTFFKLDTTTGKKERIAEINEIKEKIDAVDLFLSTNEDTLFFTNRVNGLLYRLNL